MSNLERAILYNQATDYENQLQVLEAGIAPDLSGATQVTLYVRPAKDTPDSQSTPVTLLGADGERLVGGTLGLVISDTDLAALAPGNYFWNVLVVKSDGKRLYYPDNPAPFTIMGGGA